MPYHHLALAAKDMKKTHSFYEGIMGFELVKVEIANTPDGGWGKHFFYRMDGDDSKFIAFWELHDCPNQEKFVYDLNKAAHLPILTNHYAFSVQSKQELMQWKQKWLDAKLNIVEIDHNWCYSIYTQDPSGNYVEFCLTTQLFSADDRQRALKALEQQDFIPTPKPAYINIETPEQ